MSDACDDQDKARALDSICAILCVAPDNMVELIEHLAESLRQRENAAGPMPEWMKLVGCGHKLAEVPR